MRLCKFEIANFKGIQNASFEWDDVIVLIGENNAGKSTILQALQWFLGGSQVKDANLFFNHLADAEHAIELVGHFDQLSDPERQAQAARGRLHGDKWIIKKRFWLEGQENGNNEGSWKEQYYSYSSEEGLSGWPENDNSWKNFPPDYQALIEKLPNKGSRPTNETRTALREIVRQQKPELIMTNPPSWIMNPGGGGNWKSNANSILPRCIFVKAVHDASDEAVSKDASSYGKIVELIIEKKLALRREFQALRESIANVLKLFNPDPDHPELQAQEIREVEERINARLDQVIGGTVKIRTSDPDVQPMILPSTTLALRDRDGGVETPVGHQGHGLQRTLVMALLQILSEVEAEPAPGSEAQPPQEVYARPVILAVEEPELYMHPQVERKMRDALYRLASQPGIQVICSTHSPVFLDMARRHKAIVRVVKDPQRNVTLSQVAEDIFSGQDPESDRDRLNFLAQFHPTVNEVFFAKRVILLEERSAIVAFERAAELTGLFDRHPSVRHDVTLIDCDGKPNIPAFQRALNHFRIPYAVVHDEDSDNPTAQATNSRIASLLNAPCLQNKRFMLTPNHLEGLLGYTPVGKGKPYQAIKRVEHLHAASTLPADFLKAMNWVYFGQESEPVPAASR
jgi:energy-coupling factor transporter ATP-binding protein EcfA2